MAEIDDRHYDWLVTNECSHGHLLINECDECEAEGAYDE